MKLNSQPAATVHTSNIFNIGQILWISNAKKPILEHQFLNN